MSFRVETTSGLSRVIETLPSGDEQILGEFASESEAWVWLSRHFDGLDASEREADHHGDQSSPP